METKTLLSKQGNGTTSSKKIHRKLFTFKTKKRSSNAASLKLLFKKLNATVEKLNSLKENSLAFANASATKFEKLSRETNIDVKDLLANAALVGYDPTNSLLQPVSSPVPSIAGTFIDPDSVYKYGQRSIHAEGEGDGIITQEWGGNADQYDFLHLDWKFNYTPPVSAFYNFNTSIIAACPYYLVADDGACNNNEASCRINVQSYVYQNLPFGAFIPSNDHLSYVEVDGPNSDIFTDGDDNINKFDTCVAADNIDINGVFLFGNIPADITVYVTCEVMGKGAGSIADMNFTQGNGAVVCPGLSVKPG
jgi:hypothetical protein